MSKGFMGHGNFTVDLYRPFIQQTIWGPQTMTYTLKQQYGTLVFTFILDYEVLKCTNLVFLSPNI